MRIRERLSRWFRKQFPGWFTITRALGLLLLIGAALLVYRKYGLDWSLIEEHLFDNVVTDAAGIVFAILVLDTLSEGRAKRERKRAIIQKMGSPVNDAALEALRIAKIEGWDSDGSLQGANLGGANLQGADLLRANLQGANLWRANLEGAYLRHARLEGAYLRHARLGGAVLWRATVKGAVLWGANLEGAYLGSANLEGADLRRVNLEGADLRRINLEGANLRHVNLEGGILRYANLKVAELGYANLQGAHLVDASLEGAHLVDASLHGADLENARFDEKTVLPDGTNWTPDAAMTRFTDPNHPDFWRLDDPMSPARHERLSRPGSDDN